MSRRFERRRPAALLRAIFDPATYVVLASVARTADQRIDVLRRYVLGAGDYPARIGVRTPTGPLTLTAFGADDLLTINEVFFRLDYRATGDERVVVDVGANVGVSAAYFLSRHAAAYVYAYEPLPQNIERLRSNLEPFEGRFELHPTAVGTHSGTVEFGFEPTGRYGGIGNLTGNYLTVPCIDVNEVLRSVIEEHGRIDLVKIDVETLEGELLAALDPDVAAAVGRFYVELRPSTNPLAATHDLHQRGSVARFTRRRA